MKNIKNILLFFLIWSFSISVRGQCSTCQVRLNIEGCSITMTETKSGQSFVFDKVVKMDCSKGQVTLSNGVTTTIISNTQVRSPIGIQTDAQQLCSYVDTLIGCIDCCELPEPPDSISIKNEYVTDEGNMVREEKSAGNYQMSGGSYFIYIRNTGCTPITVNGETVSPNGIYQCGSQVNEFSEKRDLCPATSIVIPPTGFAWCSSFYPSN